MGKDLKSIAEVAAMMGVSSRAVRQWCARGLFPHAERIGESRRTTWVIPVADLDGFQRPKKTGRPKKEAAPKK